MHQLQRFWVRSQHPSAQWNLRGGRWRSAEYTVVRKKKWKSPPPQKKKINLSAFSKANLRSNSLWDALIVFVNNLAVCWCTAVLGWLNIGQLQVPATYSRPNTRLSKVCNPYANLILTLTNKVPVWNNKTLAASSFTLIDVKIVLAFD